MKMHLSLRTKTFGRLARAVACSAVFGCSAVWAAEDADPVALVRPKLPPVSVKLLDFPERLQAEKIGRAIEASIVARDMTVLELLMDKDVLLDRTVGKDSLPADEDLRFRQQTKASLMPSMELIRTLADGGTYRFLRAYKRDGVVKLLFRMAANVGLNYHELELKPCGPDKKLKVVDIYVYLGCENVSETLRRAYLPVYEKRMGIHELSEADRQYLENIPRLKEMAIAGQNSEWKEMLGIYASLPRLVRENKGVLVMRLRAAVNLRTVEIYEQIILDLYRLYPNTGTPDLVSIDYYQLKGQGQQSLDACDRLDQHLGGDPFLDLMRAGGYMCLHELETAREKAWNAAHVEPKSPLPLWVLTKIAVEQQDFDECARLLLVLEYGLKAKMPELEALAMYRPFLRSDAYEAWCTKRIALNAGKDKWDGMFAGRSNPEPGELTALREQGKARTETKSGDASFLAEAEEGKGGKPELPVGKALTAATRGSASAGKTAAKAPEKAPEKSTAAKGSSSPASPSATGSKTVVKSPDKSVALKGPASASPATAKTAEAPKEKPVASEPLVSAPTAPEKPAGPKKPSSADRLAASIAKARAERAKKAAALAGGEKPEAANENPGKRDGVPQTTRKDPPSTAPVRE